MGADIGCVERWWVQASKYMKPSEYQILERLLENHGHDIAYDYAFKKVPSGTLTHIDEIEITELESYPSTALTQFVSEKKSWSEFPVLSLYFSSLENEYWFYDLDCLDLLEIELNLLRKDLQKEYNSQWISYKELDKKFWNLPEDVNKKERVRVLKQRDEFCSVQLMFKYIQVAKNRKMAILAY